MKKTMQMLFAAAVTLVLASCGNSNNYKIEGQGFDNMNGQTVYFIDQASMGTISDSAVVSNGRFTFEGTVDTPWVGAVAFLGGEGMSCVVEPGTIHITPDSLWGTPLNGQMNKFIQKTKMEDLQQEMDMWTAFYNTPDAEQRAEAEKKLDSISEVGGQRMTEALQELHDNNGDNILGAMALLGLAEGGDMTFGQLDSILKTAAPVVANFEPLKDVLEELRKADATSAGHPYIDIEGQWRSENGELKDGKLSDLANGHLTLVDFFASWCGPCRQEIENNLIGLWNKYKGQGLVLVGLNVWERGNAEKRAADLQKVIADLGIKYPVLVDSTHNATDTYGVQGIPQILLIGADGTILARDLRDKDIEEAIKKALVK